MVREGLRWSRKNYRVFWAVILTSLFWLAILNVALMVLMGKKADGGDDANLRKVEVDEVMLD